MIPPIIVSVITIITRDSKWRQCQYGQPYITTPIYQQVKYAEGHWYPMTTVKAEADKMQMNSGLWSWLQKSPPQGLQCNHWTFDYACSCEITEHYWQTRLVRLPAKQSLFEKHLPLSVLEVTEFRIFCKITFSCTFAVMQILENIGSLPFISLYLVPMPVASKRPHPSEKHWVACDGLLLPGRRRSH
jgi:hypothetical protein